MFQAIYNSLHNLLLACKKKEKELSLKWEAEGKRSLKEDDITSLIENDQSLNNCEELYLDVAYIDANNIWRTCYKKKIK